MARNLSHNMKRLVAGVCALALVGGAVPVEPIAQLFNSASITASANSPDYTVDVDFDNDTNSNDAGSVECSTSYNGELFYNYTATANDGYEFVKFTYIDTSEGEKECTNNPLTINSSNILDYQFLQAHFRAVSDKTAPTASDFNFTEPADLNYNGNPKAASVQGVEGMGTINVKYYSDPDCRTEAAPEDAGTYYVGIVVDEGDNYAASDGVIHDGSWYFTIDKISPTYEVTENTGLTYDGTAKALVTTTGTGGQIHYRYKKSTDEDYGDWSETIPSPTDAGEYYIQWYSEESKNYKAVITGNKPNVVIAHIEKATPTAADFTFTPPANTSYSGTAKAATVAPRSGISGMGALNVYYYYDEEWRSTAPSSVGTYRVRVEAMEGPNFYPAIGITDDTWTFTIALATPALTLSNLGDNVVVMETNGTVVEPADGIYTLKATKQYYIYTDKSIASGDATDELSMQRKTSATYTTYNGHVYGYRFQINVPEIPESTDYALSHENAWTGSVPNNNKDTLYVADGTPNIKDPNQIAATLQTNGVIYYGDTLSTDCVVIRKGFVEIVKTENVYLTKEDGTPVILDNNLPFGTYRLTAEVSVDRDLDGFDSDRAPGTGSDTTDQSCTMYKTIEYKPRPMTKNEYYLKNADGTETKLTVAADGTVTVPDTAFTYNAKAQKPVIVVKNGAKNTLVLSDTAKEAVAADPANNIEAQPAVVKDYENAAAEKTDAGEYSYVLEAVNTTENNKKTYTGNYSDSVTIKWKIQQADVSEYITVAPKNNVKTVSTAAANDAIVYDGAVLDKTDFTYTAAAVAEGDTDEVKAQKALAAQLVAEMNSTPATDTEPAVEAKTAFAIKGKEGTASGTIIGGTITGDTITADDSYKIICQLADIAEEKTKEYTLPEGYTFKLANECSIQDLSPTDDAADMLKVENEDGTVLLKLYHDESCQNVWTIKDVGNCGYDSTLVSVVFDAEKHTGVICGYDQAHYDEALADLAGYDIKSAGIQKGTVTLTNPNFKDINAEVTPTIAKRNATLTPDKDQSMTYRDKEVPAITYSIEDAKADGLTGVIAADKALFQTTTGEGNAAVTTNSGTVIVGDDFSYEEKDGNGDLMNNAGKYAYEVKADAKYSNYNIILPNETTAPKFTVKPMDISEADMNIVLTGDEAKGWQKRFDWGHYTYDGTIKEVDVAKVSKLKNTTFQNDQALFAVPGNIYLGSFDGQAIESNSDKKLTNHGVTLDYEQITDGKLIVDNTKGITITAPEGRKIDNVILYFDCVDPASLKTSDFATNDPDAKATWIYSTSKTSACCHVYTNDLASFNLTMSADKSISIYKIDVDLDKDEYVLAEYDPETKEGDYTVCGSTKGIYKHEYEVQIKGENNYTGVATKTWSIEDAAAPEASIILEGFSADETADGIAKTYDGKAVKARIGYTDDDYADNVIGKPEIVFYNASDWDDTRNAPIDNAVKLDSAPKNAGDYVATVTIMSDGYADQTVVQKFTINKAIISFAENADTTKTITYGEELPEVTADDIAVLKGLSDEDFAMMTQFALDGKLVFKKWENDSNILYIYSTDSEVSAALYHLGENYTSNGPTYWTLVEKPKSVRSEDIRVEFNDKLILEENSFVAPEAIKVYDGETLLTEDDYDIITPSTAVEGEFNITIVGKGNYKNYRTDTFRVDTKKQAAINKIIETTTLVLSEPKPTVNASGVGRVTVTATRGVPEDSGLTIKETGFIYVKDASNTDALTLENANDANCVVTKILAGTTNGSKTAHFTDPEGKGVRVVAFAVVSDGTYETTIYTDEVKTTYTELKTAADEKAIADAKKAIAEATTLELSEPKPTVNSSGVGRVTVTATRGVPEDSGLTIVETGMIYVKDASNTDVLTLENANDENCAVTKILAGTTNGSKTAHFTDPEGKGARVVAYAVVSDGTYETTVYTDEVNATFAGLAEEADAMVNIEEATTLTLSAPKATVNASGVGRVTVTASRAVEEGYTIEETGFIYVKDTSVETALTLENVGKDGIAKNLAGTTNGGKTAHFTDPDDKGVRVVAYAIVTDGTYSKTFYTDEVSAKYSELSAMS